MNEVKDNVVCPRCGKASTERGQFCNSCVSIMLSAEREEPQIPSDVMEEIILWFAKGYGIPHCYEHTIKLIIKKNRSKDEYLYLRNFG